MKRKSLFILPLLILGMGLAACETKATAEDAINDAKNLGTLVLKSDGSNATIGNTYFPKEGDVFYVLTKHVYQDFEVTINWASDNDNVTFEDVTIIFGQPAENRQKVNIQFGLLAEHDYLATITGTLSCENVQSSEVNFKTNVIHLSSRDATIKELKEGYKDSSYNSSLSDENVVFKPAYRLSLYGYVVGRYEENTTHLSYGVWIQDGADGIQLLNTSDGKLAALWIENEIAIGDFVRVIGNAAGSNGVLQLKPVLLMKATPSEHPTVTLPIETVLADADNWDATLLLNKDSNIVEVQNLVYASGTPGSVGSNWTIRFEGTKSDETTRIEVAVYISYHIGSTAQNAIKDMMTDWVVGTTTVDIKGFTYFIGASPRLALAFLEDLTPDQCITVL